LRIQTTILVFNGISEKLFLYRYILILYNFALRSVKILLTYLYDQCSLLYTISFILFNLFNQFYHSSILSFLYYFWQIYSFSLSLFILIFHNSFNSWFFTVTIFILFDLLQRSNWSGRISHLLICTEKNSNLES